MSPARCRLTPYPPADFLARLEPTERHLVGHGYGRLIYFKSHRLQDAVAAIVARPFLPFGAAVRGAVAAYVLVNSATSPSIASALTRPAERHGAELGKLGNKKQVWPGLEARSKLCYFAVFGRTPSKGVICAAPVLSGCDDRTLWVVWE